MTWYKWSDVRPVSGDKVIIACDDGCSSFIAYMLDCGLLHAEDATEIQDFVTDGCIWTKLPDDYVIAFTEINDSDWY